MWRGWVAYCWSYVIKFSLFLPILHSKHRNIQYWPNDIHNALIVIPPPGKTNKWKYNVLRFIRPSVRPFICLLPNVWTEYSENKMNTTGLQCNDTKWSTLGTQGSKVKVTRGSLAVAPFLTLLGQLDPLGSTKFSSYL